MDKWSKTKQNKIIILKKISNLNNNELSAVYKNSERQLAKIIKMELTERGRHSTVTQSPIKMA